MANKFSVRVSWCFFAVSFSSLAVGATGTVDQQVTTSLAGEMANPSSAEGLPRDSSESEAAVRPALIRQLNLWHWQRGITYLHLHPELPVYQLHQHGPWQYQVQREDEHFYAMTYYHDQVVECFKLKPR